MGAILPVKQHGERLLSGMAPERPSRVAVTKHVSFTCPTTRPNAVRDSSKDKQRDVSHRDKISYLWNRFRR
jgi:hypothetical protein